MALPFFPFDMHSPNSSTEGSGLEKRKIFETSTSKRKNHFTTSLPFLCEENDMNIASVSSHSTTNGYVPTYRSSNATSTTAFEKVMPMFRSNANCNTEQLSNGNHHRNFGNHGYHSDNFSSSRHGASPVPSVVSSEYSVSPYPLDAPSPTPLVAYYRDGAESFGTPMREAVDTPFSPPSNQYYFTPVNANAYDSPTRIPKEDDCTRDNSTTKILRDQLVGHHSAPPQCRPCSTPENPVNSNQFAQYKRDKQLQIPEATTIPNDRSYLSTAIRGNELSKVAALSAQSREENDIATDADFDRSSAGTSGQSIIFPLPQNLKGDPHRQAKVKTELCLSFSRGVECPFGSRCNYAHGEDELKYTKLFELEKAGLVTDINSYRAYPCFSWVSTGACPFGLRCSHLHDPRAAGSESSWLPHCDVPISSLQTDLIVDRSHHRILATLCQINPLVPNLLWDHRPSLKRKAPNSDTASETEWRDTYSLVCNLANLNPARRSRPSTISKVKISELQRICMAVQMDYGDETYIYKPKHLVYNELCMVLQTKYFRFLKPNFCPGSLAIENCPEVNSIACEITKDDYEASTSFWKRDEAKSNGDVVVVHELVFGCAGEPAARRSLWFNIHDLREVTPPEIKRLKRTRQRIKNTSSNSDAKKIMPYPGYKRIVSSLHRDRSIASRARTPSSFDTHPHKPFFRITPTVDPSVSFKLETDMLYHRINVLIQREYRAFKGTDAEVRSFITAKDSELMASFGMMKTAAKNWKWSVARGRDSTSVDSRVPKCSSEYTPSRTSHVTSIWDKFISCSNAEFKDEKIENAHELKYSRLSIFCQLAESKSFKNAVKPHIKRGSKGESNDGPWKSILLANGNNEGWEMIKSHYLGSKPTTKDKCMPLSPANGDRVANTTVA